MIMGNTSIFWGNPKGSIIMIFSENWSVGHRFGTNVQGVDILAPIDFNPSDNLLKIFGNPNEK